jgi:hypothetical protein
MNLEDLNKVLEILKNSTTMPTLDGHFDSYSGGYVDKRRMFKDLLDKFPEYTKEIKDYYLKEEKKYLIYEESPEYAKSQEENKIRERHEEVKERLKQHLAEYRESTKHIKLKDSIREILTHSRGL